jgi:four helix bundle protein
LSTSKAKNLKLKMQNHNLKLKADLKTRSYKYAIRIVEFIDEFPNDMSTHVIAKQLIRAATSIGANIIEAHSSSSKKDFANFFNHSLKSANETKFGLGLLRDTKKIDKTKIEPLLQEAKELANMLASSLLTMRGKKWFWGFSCGF